MSKMMVSEEMKNAPAAPSPLRRLLCWEGFLLAVTLAVFIGNAVASPYFLNIWNLSDATFTFTEKAIVVLPMAMLIIAREIDLSVASTMALSSTVMGFCAAAGMDTPLLVVIGLGVGLLCGLFNGLLVTRFNLSSIVITIGTMSLYRGITYILLGDQALNHYPESFAWFGQGYVWGALSFVRAGWADGRAGGGPADLTARQYPPHPGDGLGAGGCHHGGARRRQYSRRLRQHARGDHRRLSDGAGDLRP